MKDCFFMGPNHDCSNSSNSSNIRQLFKVFYQQCPMSIENTMFVLYVVFNFLSFLINFIGDFNDDHTGVCDEVEWYFKFYGLYKKN